MAATATGTVTTVTELAPTEPPRRPLSAYNYFFKAERGRLLGHDEEKLEVQGKKPKRRKHRKSHGQIGFRELANHVGQKWKSMSDEEKTPFLKLFEEDRTRYKAELRVWEEHQKRKVADERKLKKAEALRVKAEAKAKAKAIKAEARAAKAAAKAAKASAKSPSNSKARAKVVSQDQTIRTPPPPPVDYLSSAIDGAISILNEDIPIYDTMASNFHHPFGSMGPYGQKRPLSSFGPSTAEFLPELDVLGSEEHQDLSDFLFSEFDFDAKPKDEAQPPVPFYPSKSLPVPPPTRPSLKHVAPLEPTEMTPSFFALENELRGILGHEMICQMMSS